MIAAKFKRINYWGELIRTVIGSRLAGDPAVY